MLNNKTNNSDHFNTFRKINVAESKKDYLLRPV